MAVAPGRFMGWRGRGLHEGEDEDLGADYAQEHGQRVDGRVGNGGGVALGGAVGVGQGRRVGVAARHEAHDVEEVDFVDLAGNGADDKQGHDGYYEAPDHPPHSGQVEGRCSEAFAGGYANGGEEEADAEFAHQHRGGGGGVGDEFGFIAEARQQDGNNERAAGEAEFHAVAEVDGANDDAKQDADKDGNEVRLVEAAQGVAEFVGQAVDVVESANNRYAVAHLQAQAGGGEQVNAAAVNAGCVELVGAVEVELAEGHAKFLQR